MGRVRGNVFRLANDHDEMRPYLHRGLQERVVTAFQGKRDALAVEARVVNGHGHFDGFSSVVSAARGLAVLLD